MAKLSRFRRISATLSVLGVIAGGVLVAQATPASAAGGFQTFSPVSTAHTDVTSPLRSFDNAGKATPVGATLDTKHGYHASKSYFTYDLTPLIGTQIFSVYASTVETKVNDCSKPRSTELWSASSSEHPTWVSQPAEQVKQNGPLTEDICVSPEIEWDTTQAVQAAVAAHQSKLTLVMRLPDDKQLDPAYGREYASGLSLLINLNHAPNTPTELSVDRKPCGSAPLLTPEQYPELITRVNDPDAVGNQGTDSLTATFTIRNIADPSEKFVSTANGVAGTLVGNEPSGALRDGQTYELTVQVDDGHAVSPVSAPCRFTVDTTAPTPPTVTSADYAENGTFPGTGGQGLTGKFTFTANGASDVTGYYYGEFGHTTYVAAGKLGGEATIDYNPTSSGPHTLQVRSVDNAGNQSSETNYVFWVRNIEPGFTSTPEHGDIGVARVLTFTPGMPDVVEYGYHIDNGPAQTIAAGPDGTASINYPATVSGPHHIYVTNTTSSGLTSAAVDDYVYVGGDQPTVNSDTYSVFGGGGIGISGTFTFTSELLNVSEYTYSFNGGAEVTIPADADGSAAISFAPTATGSQNVVVTAENPTGLKSDPTTYDFVVPGTP